MNALDSFDPAPPRQPGRVSRLDVHLIVRERDVPAVLDEQGAEVTPATVERTYEATYEFGVPDVGGQSPELRKGELTNHLTPTRKGHVKGLMDHLMDSANAHLAG